jgi:hypothetical protein
MAYLFYPCYQHHSIFILTLVKKLFLNSEKYLLLIAKAVCSAVVMSMRYIQKTDRLAVNSTYATQPKKARMA